MATEGQSLDIMSDVKLIDFGSEVGDNIEHILYGFRFFFEEQARRVGPNATPEASDKMAYHVIQHIKSGSEAAKFVNRLPVETTRDFETLCQELRRRFKNWVELAEEKR